MLYQLICDAKDNGHTYDELEEATGLARGTLQNIVRGRSPKINFYTGWWYDPGDVFYSL
ncbi:MAG: hypothetical protein ACLPLP_28950 [Mycobacterium sp.]